MVKDFMLAALTQAKIAQSKHDIPIGAILVDPNNNIIAKGYNQVIDKHDPTAHAEIQVLRYAAQILKTHRFDGYDLYSTLEPCAMCAAAISLARIKRLYFASEDSKFGAVISNVRYFESTICHHKVEYYYGFYESDAKKLLKEFFMKKR